MQCRLLNFVLTIIVISHFIASIGSIDLQTINLNYVYFNSTKEKLIAIQLHSRIFFCANRIVKLWCVFSCRIIPMFTHKHTFAAQLFLVTRWWKWNVDLTHQVFFSHRHFFYQIGVFGNWGYVTDSLQDIYLLALRKYLLRFFWCNRMVTLIVLWGRLSNAVLFACHYVWQGNDESIKSYMKLSFLDI